MAANTLKMLTFVICDCRGENMKHFELDSTTYKHINLYCNIVVKLFFGPKHNVYALFMIHRSILIATTLLENAYLIPLQNLHNPQRKIGGQCGQIGNNCSHNFGHAACAALASDEDKLKRSVVTNGRLAHRTTRVRIPGGLYRVKVGDSSDVSSAKYIIAF